MGCKIVLLLGLSIAFVLLTSSEVAARDLAKPTQKNSNPSPVEGASLDGGRRHEEVSGIHRSRELEGGGGGHYHEGGKRGDNCSYICQRIYSRCCSAAEAQALKNTQVKPHN